MSDPTHVVLRLDQIPKHMRKEILAAGAQTLVAETGVNFTWQELFDKWVTYIRVKHARRTCDIYIACVQKLVSGTRWSQQFVVPTSEELSRVINHKDWSFGYRVSIRTGLCSFFLWIKNEGLIMNNPVDNVPATWRDLPVNRVVRSCANPPFTHAEYEKMMREQRFKDFWRHGVMIAYWMGLRMGDVVSLRFGNFLEDDLQICVNKTGDILQLPYDHPQLGAGIIRKVLAEMREKRPKADKDSLCFPIAHYWYNNGKGTNVTLRFARICTRHKIPPKGFHSLRRACIERCKAAGLTLQDIGKIVGHSATATTFKYLRTAVDAAELNQHAKNEDDTW